MSGFGHNGMIYAKQKGNHGMFHAKQKGNHGMLHAKQKITMVCSRCYVCEMYNEELLIWVMK